MRREMQPKRSHRRDSRDDILFLKNALGKAESRLTVAVAPIAMFDFRENARTGSTIDQNPRPGEVDGRSDRRSNGQPESVQLF